MQQNDLFDVVVLGASNEGIALCEYIKTKAPEKNVALVSRHFNFVKPNNKLADTVLITGDSAFSSYVKGLVVLTLKNKKTVCGKNLVIATGATPIKTTTLKNNNICYSPRDLKPAKMKPAIVYGDGTTAVKYSLQMAKKFKYVYLCSDTFKLNCESKLARRLNDTANIVHLPNCHITTCKNNKDGNLCEVTLDTYDTINCSALVMALGRMPDVNGIDTKMVELDQDRYIKINSLHQTTKVPNIYAIGECTRHNTKRSITTVGSRLVR
ncbi:MAG: FAD-dependent oxidoreductase [Candidatus Riflebacteria bacterium]|nr:FAD-dependent oxidoreductase [Candidatus Riflebacteria bacterium]